MAVTDNFRKQHAEMIEAVQSIQPQLKPELLAADAADIRSRLSQLFGKLSLHLAMEDNSLYPRYQKHADAKIRDTADRFAKEMNGVKPAIEAFSQKWTEREIKADPPGFCADATRLFNLLADRIRRENTEFYPLLDKVG
jgi:hemerythrin-like domain-containing protein